MSEKSVREILVDLFDTAAEFYPYANVNDTECQKEIDKRILLIKSSLLAELPDKKDPYASIKGTVRRNKSDGWNDAIDAMREKIKGLFL